MNYFIYFTKKLVHLTHACVKRSGTAVKMVEITLTYFGRKQGDTLSPLLFNVALESTVYKTGIKTLLFPNRYLAGVKDDFIKLEHSSKRLGLITNEHKTEYMVPTRTKGRNKIAQTITKEHYNIERIQEFKYLGATIISDNNITNEINSRIQCVNHCCFQLKTYLGKYRNKIRNRKTYYDKCM